MRPSIVVALGLSVVSTACGGGAGGTDAGPAPFDAACEGCAALTFSLEALGDGSSPPAPVVDGGQVPWVWGPQGGSMVQPLLVFDGARVAAGTDVLITVRHSVDPAAPERFAPVSGFPETSFPVRLTTDERGRVVAGPLNDQLSWSAIDGARFLYDVEVSAPGLGVASRRAAVTLSTMAVADGCAAFPLEGSGCMYRAIPGIVVVPPIEPAGPADAACADGARVKFVFTPEPGDASRCLASEPAWAGSGRMLPYAATFSVFGGYAPPRACLDPLGIRESATLPARLLVQEVGSCSPLSVRLEADTSSCEAMCVLPGG